MMLKYSNNHSSIIYPQSIKTYRYRVTISFHIPVPLYSCHGNIITVLAGKGRIGVSQGALDGLRVRLLG